MAQGSTSQLPNVGNKSEMGWYDPTSGAHYYPHRPQGSPLRQNFTRPNDTNTYGAGDAVNNSTSAPTVITFTSAARNSAWGGWITGAVMVKSTNGSTSDSFELLLFDTTITMTNDNSAFAVTDAESRTWLGSILFPVATDLGSANRGYQGVLTNGPIRFSAVATSLFGALVARGAYAPGAQERFDITLIVDYD